MYMLALGVDPTNARVKLAIDQVTAPALLQPLQLCNNCVLQLDGIVNGSAEDSALTDPQVVF